MFHLIKSYFCLSHDFETWFQDVNRLLYYPQMSVFLFHVFFRCLILVSKKRNIEAMLILTYS